MKPTAKPITGILLLNKPQGITSNGALQRIKHLYQAKKAGHTGSLDPLATGMLPICFGEATKLCQYMLDADKVYQATAMLGIKTNTGDAQGQVIATTNKPLAIDKTQLELVLKQFIGLSFQTPSMFSALKHNGTPLYKYARQGQEITRNPRPIEIKSLSLDEFDGTLCSITVHCSKGTYIRNLVEDIGEKLGVGAHVTQLHRVYTAGFANQPMYHLEHLAQCSSEQLNNYLLPMDLAVTHLPRLTMQESDISALKQGKIINLSQPFTASDCIRLYNSAGIFAGLGMISTTGDLKAKRLCAIKQQTITS